MVDQVAGTCKHPRGEIHQNTRRGLGVGEVVGLAWVVGALVAGEVEARRAASWDPAAPTCTVAKESGTTLAGSIAFEPDPGVSPRRVAEAIALWSACANYGSGFPRLVAGGEGTRVIHVVLATRIEGRRCGSFEASTIRLYAVARDQGQVLPCTDPDRILAHEIGHALGLADAPAAPACRDHIMAQVFRPHDVVRRVQPSECQAVGQHWLTPVEHDVQERLVTEWAGETSLQPAPAQSSSKEVR